MPLSNDKYFGTTALTEAINNLPTTPSTIRAMGLFEPKPLDTASVKIEMQDGVLTLVPSKPYGAAGEPVKTKERKAFMLEVPHLPQDDVVLNAEVLGVREFGTKKQLLPTAKVNEKLADMKLNLEYTREHMQLGALQGKIYDSDKTLLVDIYKHFGVKRTEVTWNLSNEKQDVNKLIDTLKTLLKKQKKGEMVKGFAVLASPELMQAVVYHPTVKELYDKYQSGAAKYLGDTEVEFEHKGIKFIQYDDKFDTPADIKEGEGLILPLGTRNTFKEFFAPADLEGAIGTQGKPYYASRERMRHGKGWDVHAQSNPLPMVLRPGLCATIKTS